MFTAKHLWNLWEISMWKQLEATGVTAMTQLPFNESWKSPIRRADISRNDEMEIVHPLQIVKDTQNI